MATKVSKDQAAELLADAINGVNATEAAPEPFVPLGPPTGWDLVISVCGRYGASLRPWVRGVLLAVAGLAAGFTGVASVLLVALAAPLAARVWTATRIRRRNRRVVAGKDPDGRAIRQTTAAQRKARATVGGGAVGLWLLAASAVGQTVGFVSTVGGLFWLSAVGLWGALFVPAWGVTDGRRSTPVGPSVDGLTDGYPDGLTDGVPTGLTDWENTPVGDTVGAPTDGRRSDPSMDPVGTPSVAVGRRPTVPVGDPRRSAEPTVDHAVGLTPSGHRLPSLQMLAVAPPAPRRPTGVGDPVGRVIDGTLREYGVGGKVTGVTAGPTVTRYAVTLDRGVSVAKFLKVEDDLTKALRLAQPITMLKSIPGRDAVGVDVPNARRATVTLGDILRGAHAVLAGHALGVGVGGTVDGQPVVVDLASLPHLLLAGATGAGKSVSLNALIVSLLMFHGPDTLGLQLIDPKRVELAKYRRLPHLVTPIAVELDQAIDAFERLVAEMEHRYDRLDSADCRNIGEYNAGVAAGRIDGDRMRHIVAICDELADLILVNKARRKAARRDDDPVPDIEDLICRLLGKARAAGIHLVLATQRPSVDVVTGLIKANLPAHLAFAVSERADSMVILDRPGAEKLLGRGDALWQPQGTALTRIQGASITDEEIDAVVAFWSALSAPTFDLAPAPVAAKPAASTPAVCYVAPEPPAREVVFEAACEMADWSGLVDKRQIVAATPGMRPGTRDKALTDLTSPDDGRLMRVADRRGAYRVVRPDADNNVGGDVPPGDGDQS